LNQEASKAQLERITQLMQEMQMTGYPPEELVGALVSVRVRFRTPNHFGFHPFSSVLIAHFLCSPRFVNVIALLGRSGDRGEMQFWGDVFVRG
jgi:hypothetical protein